MPKPNNTVHILLIEDDPRLAALVQEYLAQHNFTVDIEHRGDQACERILAEQPDLIILDLMLPGKDGLSICQEVRPHYNGPILMLTARDEDTDQIAGLDIGADDYVTKPVQPRVLLARIQALLRRYQTDSPSDTLQFGCLRINASSRAVWLNSAPLELTSNEFELLWLLANQAGEILSRDHILETLRGIGYDGLDRSVDVRISRLRKKLGDNPTQPYRIKTVRAKGYLFASNAWGE